ncbi:Alpha/Beta hydrolase protein [Armillaria mellea]|nr:Alpha/Beta hydrolase protein [Armillaria mellea]
MLSTPTDLPAPRIERHGRYTLSSHIIPAPSPRLTPHIDQPIFVDKTRASQGVETIITGRREIIKFGTPNTHRLWNCVNRYVSNRVGQGLTFVFVPGNGIPKETYEPAVQHLISASPGLVDEVWMWESVFQGDSGVLNAGKLSGAYNWEDDTRDLLEFLKHYLPPRVSRNPLPDDLSSIRIDETEVSNRIRNGFSSRKIVLVGHSYGGCISTLAALQHPTLFHSLVLIDPIIVPPRHFDSGSGKKLMTSFMKGSLLRQSTWMNWTIAEECLRQYKPYQSWAPAAFDRLILHGLRENEVDSQVHLKTSSINETILYADPITPSTVYSLLHRLDAGIQLNWVLPENGGIIGPSLTQKMIGLRPVNTKSMMIPGTSHFIPQDRPKDFADAILLLIDNKGHANARL